MLPSKHISQIVKPTPHCGNFQASPAVVVLPLCGCIVVGPLLLVEVVASRGGKGRMVRFKNLVGEGKNCVDILLE